MTWTVNTDQSGIERGKLQRASKMQGYQWLIIALSILLTISVWYFSSQTVENRAHALFKRQADSIIDLIKERMHKYEVALWAGTGAIQAHGGEISYKNWVDFAETLEIESKYPGINGIGVINYVASEQLPQYLEKQRNLRPNFRIHPPHSANIYLPITYIEPVEENAQAVGLDMAHEVNRFTAAKRARDTGLAQVTGPIVLVQDAGKTPGFLFYAPFYRDGKYPTVKARRQNFAGMVYAPFIVKSLMQGALELSQRDVNIRIEDQGEILYDEQRADTTDFDSKPMFTESIDIDLYGRVWRFDIRSTHSFRKIVSNSLPTLILIAGFTITGMLVWLFRFLSVANRQALRYAELVTLELANKAARLERSNEDLEQFAYVASHDLQEPLRMVGNFTQLLQQRYSGQLDETADRYIQYSVDGVKRMQHLLIELLQYARITSGEEILQPTDLAAVCRDVLESLQVYVEGADATVNIGELPVVMAETFQVNQLFQNLITNAIRFRDISRPPVVNIGCTDNGTEWLFHVQDNGIGVESHYFEKIFVMFQRLHERNSYEGSGVGLAICKKVVIAHGGNIWVESKPGFGSSFYFTLPKSAGLQNVVPLHPHPQKQKSQDLDCATCILKNH